MQNDDTGVPAEEVLEQTVEVETPSTEETPAEPQSGEEVNLEAELAHAKSEAAKFRRLLEKAQKPKATEATQKTPPSSVEETVLLAQGMSEDLLSELKAVAKVRNVSLIKAQADPIFTMIKEKFEKDLKQKEASLPASRGSSSAKVKKDFNTPNLTREEHKRMFNEFE